MQTDIYLEDQYGKKTFNDFDTQTDPFLDRPATPYFIPWKSGPDAFTQVTAGIAASHFLFCPQTSTTNRT